MKRPFNERRRWRLHAWLMRYWWKITYTRWWSRLTGDSRNGYRWQDALARPLCWMLGHDYSHLQIDEHGYCGWCGKQHTGYCRTCWHEHGRNGI